MSTTSTTTITPSAPTNGKLPDAEAQLAAAIAAAEQAAKDAEALMAKATEARDNANKQRRAIALSKVDTSLTVATEARTAGDFEGLLAAINEARDQTIEAMRNEGLKVPGSRRSGGTGGGHFDVQKHTLATLARNPGKPFTVAQMVSAVAATPEAQSAKWSRSSGATSNAMQSAVDKGLALWTDDSVKTVVGNEVITADGEKSGTDPTK
jgi:hypothetical protein